MGCYIKNIKGFSLVETIISVMLISLFATGMFYFFNVQNKNIIFFINDEHSEDLVNEAFIFLENYTIKNLPEGTYSLSYERDSTQDTGSMFLKMISSDDNIIQEGEYINKNGETIENNNLSMDKTLFKRTIVIKEVISPFIAQKIKNITVQIWYPGCDFSSDPCKSKSFLITEPHLYE